MLFLAALIFAVPKVGIRKRVLGVAMGIPVIYFGNVMRILLVVCLWKSFGYGIAEVFHDYLWQAGLAIVVLTAWVVWLKWSGRLGRTFLK
jgi:exosortase/archaeosortase family protein